MWIVVELPSGYAHSDVRYCPSLVIVALRLIGLPLSWHLSTRPHVWLILGLGVTLRTATTLPLLTLGWTVLKLLPLPRLCMCRLTLLTVDENITVP